MWPSRNNLRVMENLGAMPKLRELKFGLLDGRAKAWEDVSLTCWKIRSDVPLRDGM